MKTKIFALLILLGLFFSVDLMAQGKGKGKGLNKPKGPKPAEERARKYTDKLTEKLGLSADQKNQVYDINLAAAKQVDGLRANNQPGKVDRPENVQKRKAIEEERDSKIVALLSDEQKTKYNQYKEEKKAKALDKLKNKGKGKGKGKPAGPADDDEDEDDGK
jgi:hypothetical protein